MRSFQEEYAAIKLEFRNSKFCKDLDYVLDYVEAASKSRPLVLYGARSGGLRFLNSCRERGLEVRFFCDREVKGRLEGIEVITPDTLEAKYSSSVVIVASVRFNDEICATLKDFGFAPEQIVPFPLLDFPYCFLSTHEFEAHVDGYEWAYNFFKDERSKQLVLDKIRLTLGDAAIAINTSCDLYYEDDFIKLGDNEVYVDGGAGNGDTAEFFLKKIKNMGIKCQVHSFEPYKDHYEKTVLRLSNIPNVTVVPKGLWKYETELAFVPNPAAPGSSSFVFWNNTPGAFHVPVTSLDSYFKNKPDSEWPTFIKMDIEGSEREALLGSAEIIRKRKPKLAICAYHKPEDIYELPKTIYYIRDDYQFALRQHSSGWHNTVLYAV
jgi:FkbM family methyltransferase